MSYVVAFQGERGAFGEEAIAAAWPNEGIPLPLATFADVVSAVGDGRAHRGVLPVENSIAGHVEESAAALAAAHEVHVVGETMVPITQCLLAPPGASIETIVSVESHAVALAQCTRFLRRHPHLSVVAVCDTAGAAREVAAANDTRRAAIAGRRAALRYGLTILAEHIEDDITNRTRFVIIARRPEHESRRSVAATWRRVHAIRGATTVEADDPGEIRAATRELLREVVARNAIKTEEIVSVLFSATGDLTSEFPARAARDMGWTDTPLMCMGEIPVPGSLARCIRVMLHVELAEARSPMVPVYLRHAAALRGDITVNA